MSDQDKTMLKKSSAKIGHLRKEAKNKAGETGLIIRDFSKPGEVTGDLIGPQPKEARILHLGVLTGESYLKYPRGDTEIMHPWSTDLFAYGSYIYPKDLGLFCSRFIQKRAGPLLFGFRLDTEDLARISEGEISISRSELRRAFNHKTKLEYWNDFANPDYLKEVHFAIGDEDVSNLLESAHIPNPDRIITLLKDKKYAQSEIDGYYGEIASSNARNLVETINTLAPNVSKLHDKEERLLRITGDYWQEQDGVEFSYGDFDYEQLGIYEGLRSRLSSQIKHAEELMKRKLPQVIESTSPGIPAETKTNQYLEYVREDVINPARESLQRIDKHLKDIRDEAHKRAFPDRYT